MDDIEEIEVYKESKRERRIKNRLRMIERGKRQYKQNYFRVWWSHSHYYEEAEMHGRRFHDNLQACSCDMCCNPRRSGWNSPRYRLTNQERRALQDANQQFTEIGLHKRKRKS